MTNCDALYTSTNNASDASVYMTKIAQNDDIFVVYGTHTHLIAKY